MQPSSKGFSLVELLVVMAIIVILLGSTTLYLRQNQGGIRLDSIVNETVTLLRSAQQKSLNQQDGARWGVYADNTDSEHPFLDLFMINEAALNDPGMPGTSEQRLKLPGAVQFTTPSSGSDLRIIFSKGTGLPTEENEIVFQSGTTSHTVSIEANGRVSF
jgi:prepilin-type N-terminal cleavage/methylation domain-containing protein